MHYYIVKRGIAQSSSYSIKEEAEGWFEKS